MEFLKVFVLMTFMAVIIDLSINWVKGLKIEKIVDNMPSIDKLIDAMVKDVENIKMSFKDVFSEAVLDLYKDFMINPNCYHINDNGCQMVISNSPLTIWAANGVEYRKFDNDGTSSKTTAKEFNAKMTHADKLLLDKIVQAVKNRQKMIKTKFFIED